MKSIEIDQHITRYLSAIESGIAMSDSEAHLHRDKRAADLVSNLTNAEGHLDQIGQHEAQLLRTAIDELRVQFTLGKMEGVDKLHEIEERIASRSKKVSAALRRVKSTATDEVHDIEQGFALAWRALSTEINLLDLRYGIAEEQAGEKISTATHEVSEDLKLITRLAKERLEELKEEFQTWAKETKKSVSKRTHKTIDSIEQYLLDVH